MKEQFGVASLAVFGSVACGCDTTESDVDLIVNFVGPPTFDAFMDLKFFLEDLLGRPVDLVTEDAIRPQMKPKVLEEALVVA